MRKNVDNCGKYCVQGTVAVGTTVMPKLLGFKITNVTHAQFMHSICMCMVPTQHTLGFTLSKHYELTPESVVSSFHKSIFSCGVYFTSTGQLITAKQPDLFRMIKPGCCF
ncbi:hypothetical protein XENOCAPTIV_028299 [Xenoophorus captivus]|uniref:Uncharacterized protein n=1 Tax=Xenoophorus captivus TaxID=1517983 RepID=A0ABV0RFQ0_9TELE